MPCCDGTYYEPKVTARRIVEVRLPSREDNQGCKQGAIVLSSDLTASIMADGTALTPKVNDAA